MFSLVMFIILIAGGINWFCIGLFQFDFIAGLFGSQANFVSRFLYVIVGLAAIYLLIYIAIRKGQVSLVSKKQVKKIKSKAKAKGRKEEKKKQQEQARMEAEMPEPVPELETIEELPQTEMSLETASVDNEV